MGAYKGSWAYNVVVLYDQDGNVVPMPFGTAGVIVGKTSDGTGGTTMNTNPDVRYNPAYGAQRSHS